MLQRGLKSGLRALAAADALSFVARVDEQAFLVSSGSFPEKRLRVPGTVERRSSAKFGGFAPG